jgi:hypothetical protein
MASPVKPSDARAVIIDPSDPWCTVLKKLLKFSYLHYKLRKYETKEDGSIGDGLAADICAKVDCPDIVTP